MFLVCSSPVVAPCSIGATGAPPSQDSIPPRRLFLLSLTSVLNPSLSLSHAPRNRVSLTSVLNDMSSELDRKTSSSPDHAREIPEHLQDIQNRPQVGHLLRPPPRQRQQNIICV